MQNDIRGTMDLIRHMRKQAEKCETCKFSDVCQLETRTLSDKSDQSDGSDNAEAEAAANGRARK